MNWSASSIPRLFQCPTSALLPQHDYRTKYADEGKDHHADMEAAIDVGDEEAIPAEILALVQDGDETYTEKSFAYDVDTDAARELPTGRGPGGYAGLRDSELGGTIDLGIRGNGRVVVVDHKGHEEVDDADRNAQIATYALMIARAWGYDEVDVMIVYRATYRRPSYATLNALDLAAHADRLRRLRDDIDKARSLPQVYVNDGPHCKYCPAFLSGCPRQEALQRRVQSGELALVTEQLIPFHDDNEAARAKELSRRLGLLKQRLDAALYARAAERPFRTLEGKMFGPVTKLGNRAIDGDAAYELLRNQYGQEVADKAVTRKATQKGIVTALKAAGVKGADAKKDDLVKQLEADGKVKRESKTSIEEYDDKLLVESA